MSETVKWIFLMAANFPRRSMKEQSEQKLVSIYSKCGHRPYHIAVILTTNITRIRTDGAFVFTFMNFER